MKKLILGVLSLCLAAAVWLPFLHLFFRPQLENFRAPSGIGPDAEALAGQQLALWNDPELRALEV